MPQLSSRALTVVRGLVAVLAGATLAGAALADDVRLGATRVRFATVAEGRAVLDGTAGLWCSNAGHSRDPIVAAIQRRQDDALLAQLGLFQRFAPRQHVHAAHTQAQRFARSTFRFAAWVNSG